MEVVRDLKALIYVRVSTEEQAARGFSIQAQRTEGMNKAVELGCSHENIYIFSDEGISGAVLERPQLMAALDILRKKQVNIDFFICYDSSRLSRNAAHQLIIIDEIKRSGTKLIFIANNYQDDAEGRFQLTIMAAVDEFERARLRLRTEMGKVAKAAQHKLTHNPGIFGYDFDTKTDMLNINEGHVQTLKLIFRSLISENKRPVEIAEMLNNLQIPSPRLKQWSRVTVRRILSNPSYLGTLYIRKYDTRDCHLNKFKKEHEKIKVKVKPRNEWIPVQIPQIIDKETWDRAQEILKNPKHTSRGKNKEDFLLIPFLRCGFCGNIMKGKKVIKMDSAYRYYICPGRYANLKESRCDAKLINAKDIEKAVWDCICTDIYDFVRNEADLKKIISRYMSTKENKIVNRLIEKEKANNERERIMTMFQKGYINEDEMGRKLKSNSEKQNRINFDKVIDDEQGTSFVNRLKEDWENGTLLLLIEKALNNLDINDMRHVMNLAVSEMTIDGNTVLVSRLS